MSENDCQAAQEMASAFVDGSLGHGDAAVLQGHLRECDDCRAFMGNIFTVRNLLRVEESRHPSRAIDPGFAAAVAGRLDGERVFAKGRPSGRPPAARAFWSRLSGAAAAAALLLSVAWSWNRLATPEESSPTAADVTAPQEAEEGTMASYLREHTFQAMDATFLGHPEGVDLASFQVSGQGIE